MTREGFDRRIRRVLIHSTAAMLLLLFAGSAFTPSSAPASCESNAVAEGDTVYGTPCADIIVADPGIDVIKAGAGADTIVGASTVEVIEAGAGDDFIYADEATPNLARRLARRWPGPLQR